ncbi:alpha-1,3-mannosyl-glycoprotein 4-beta-N-acetylglucosaminyltransferase C-like [Lingula anatina]|uniref:Alpha-1,3-mannosyl-glycoprotein 4-beta-N-acetylglucosaminyltransferase C-like n=1 Tax=Lingula anatina TaxID=7574 RepID=A0A2R2MQE8_LINAN|nr:alpha-1,3-mannosyl-glycoprotein 4-beta-N-acetylglucosaminyltransferase C-like [Lingula anatina]|eukprot:XP_023932470.1 alpha-1,3-mannosyl-glycoprotein 4-beta-N-acetylglucosaminyltransferase C-like [Lingula anatina]
MARLILLQRLIAVGILFAVCSYLVLVKTFYRDVLNNGAQKAYSSDLNGDLQIEKNQTRRGQSQPTHSQLEIVELRNVSVYGNHRQKKGFLTIGIPSVKRPMGAVYLLQTITYIINRTSPSEQENIVLLVFLANFDTKYNENVLKILSAKFDDYIKSGFILVLQVPENNYPPLENLKRNYNDSPEKVKWRSKQNVDYAFMFLYGKNISEYYIQIEDDVIPALGFFKDIRDFILANDKEPWVCLEFSVLGFIGKLFKSKDLEKLARFLLLFYDEQPCDWLILHFLMSMTQKEHIYHKQSLFQHLGEWSSSEEKSRKGPKIFLDIYFKDVKNNQTISTKGKVKIKIPR